MRFIRQPLGIFLGLCFLAAAILLGAVPASAHDAAESSSPAQGATVPTPPEQISITFNNNPLALGSQVRVNDAAGTDWAEGDVEIVDNVASQKLKEGAPAGQFTVIWRVVSSDSHPIEGSFTFTATSGAATPGAATPGAAAPGAGSTAAVTSPPGTRGAVPTLGTAQPGVTPPEEFEADSSEPFPWSLVIFAAVALGILVALAVLAKRRLAPSDEEDLEQDDQLPSSRP
ncbi:copper resistance protein CopC [Arthrobacter sp.]|uniref:copper resistance CopC family protein n=1 Tax=Arthrobacter sp. TaxID=1667 RepID=UPI0028120AF1|nr:copper resistance protein CopC [Arthrobacter sp.]